MNRKALLAAALAAVAGLVLLFLYMERFKAEATGGAPVGVVFAVQDIPLGTAVTKQMVGIRPLPQAYVEDRHVLGSDARRIIGVRVSSGVKANESILWTDLATTSETRRDLSGLVRSGMRAITVRADITSAFGGLLRPGDRVDVLLTAARNETVNAEERVTIPLLQNLLVLAIGRDTGGEAVLANADPRAARGLSKSAVTLSATLAQAQILTFAGHRGDLTLILRNPDDIAVVDGLPETTAADILEPERRAQLLRRERPTQTPDTARLPERVQ
jgi:pilus assembly protein CpaB